jgi:hypothetical protein
MKRIKQIIKGYIATKRGPYSELQGILARLRMNLAGVADDHDLAIFDDIAADVLDLVQAKPAKAENEAAK